VSLTYTYGEALAQEDGSYLVSPASGLGLDFYLPAGSGRVGGPECAWRGFATLGADPASKAGLTLEADWEPATDFWAGRRYSLSVSGAGRWPEGARRPPEESWELDGAIHEAGLGLSALEAGGRAALRRHRLAGRDYAEAAGYLGTRFVLQGTPVGLNWLDPDWLRDFRALLLPPPEPGSEEALDLPSWFAAATLAGPPSLPSPGLPDGERPDRLVVETRHTQSARAYDGDGSHSWQAGETRLEVRQRRAWGEVGAGYTRTVKYYPSASSSTYQLDEGELILTGPAGAGEGRATVSLRNRQPWEAGGEAYRQYGAELGFSRSAPGQSRRWGGEWRWRRYTGASEGDYFLTRVEGEASRTAGPVKLTGGTSLSAQTYPSRVPPDQYTLRLRLKAEVATAPDQTVTAGLAWERHLAVASGGSADLRPSETLLRLAWTLAL
jgi:hypothetical protein